MALPPPSPYQTFCTVSVLEGGRLNLPQYLVLDNGVPGLVEELPSLCFLLHHSSRSERFLLDLGILRDLSGYSPRLQTLISNPIFSSNVPQDSIESLAKGNLTPDDIDYVCLSHVHWDHTANTHAFKKSTFIVTNTSKQLLEKGYPEDTESVYMSNLLPADRTRCLPDQDWRPIGPFPRAYDFYGDGSIYIVDSPGHVGGHINILARTSPDGGWIFLAADSAHNWALITGDSHINVGAPWDPKFCFHSDVEKAAEHISHIAALWKLPRVRIVLAHDGPWYEKNKNGQAFWPGHIESL
jgi:glyoxylase-like metal-dependent hydrolase (beta-lactamase superfamily II)